MGPLSSLYAQLMGQHHDEEPDMPMSPEEWAREQALRAQLSRGDDGGPVYLDGGPSDPGAVSALMRALSGRQ